MEKVNTVRISVDYDTHGYSKVVINNKDMTEAVLAELGSDVKEIIIKKRTDTKCAG